MRFIVIDSKVREVADCDATDFENLVDNAAGVCMRSWDDVVHLRDRDSGFLWVTFEPWVHDRDRRTPRKRPFLIHRSHDLCVLGANSTLAGAVERAQVMIEATRKRAAKRERELEAASLPPTVALSLTWPELEMVRVAMKQHYLDACRDYATRSTATGLLKELDALTTQLGRD